MEYLSYDHEDRPNQGKNSHKLCDEMEHTLLSLAGSQWKLRQQHDQSSNGGKAIVKQILASEERIKSNKQDCENHTSGIRARKLTI